MGHDHHHAHSHAHPGNAGRSLGLAFFLNFSFTIIELAGAWWTGSAAIAADALHDLGDSIALAFAWAMQGLADRPAPERYSYGLRRLSLVAAFVNALVLLVGGAIVLVESVPRLWDPGEPDAGGMLALALLGVVVNGAAVLRVRGGKSLNERVVSLHLLEDVLGWVAVLIVSCVMLVVEVPVLDPLLAILITLWVARSAAGNLRKTLVVFLQGTPHDVEPDDLVAAAEAVEGVVALRHVHVWSLEGEHHVLTGHLVVESEDFAQGAQVREQVREVLAGLDVKHSTLELATPDNLPASAADCRPVASHQPEDDAHGYWENHADRYKLAMWLFGRPIPEAVRRTTSLVKGADKVLEVACGTGLFTVGYAPHVGEVLATDYADAMMAIARKRAAHLSHVRFDQRDINALGEADGSFDAVVGANVLHLLPDLELALGSLRRVLKPGGLLLVPTYCHDQTLRSKAVSAVLALGSFPGERRFTVARLSSALESAGFDVVEADVIPGLLPLGFVVGRKTG